jgi:thiamine biosynthesis lipoprotein
MSAARPSRAGAALWIAIAAASLAVVAVRSERAPREFATYGATAMATDWQVVLPAGDGAEAAAEACFKLFGDLDRELSEWREGSPLTAVNRAAGVAPVAVPPELYALVERSLELGAATDGAFDVSWAALWGLWDFRAEAPRPPAATAITARLPLVDYRRVVADPGPRTLFLPAAGMKLGLGAIGKGWALDRAVELLERRGYRDFLLIGGGQVAARGARGERPWRIGVRDPRGTPDELFARVALEGASLATSADNESFFVVDGVRYHHVLDPRTGRPARGLRSATVRHRDATLADALSTAVLVLGRERGLAVAARLGAEALVVDENGETAATAGWEESLEILRPPRAAG